MEDKKQLILKWKKDFKTDETPNETELKYWIKFNIELGNGYN